MLKLSNDTRVGLTTGPEIEDGDTPEFERLPESAQLGDGAEAEFVYQPGQFARKLLSIRLAIGYRQFRR